MPATVSMKIDKRFQKHLRVIFARHAADVGVLEDKPYRLPLTMQQARKNAYRSVLREKEKTGVTYKQNTFKAKYKNFLGGLARKTGRRTDGTIAQVSKSLRRNTGINIFIKPFSLPKNRDILVFARRYVESIMRPARPKKRVENLLQAIVRNPILRGDYGRNSRATAKAKGFNRFMIDTGQLFQNIKARLSRRV